MARARNIKPGFFKNELLAELPAFDRLLFIGLWTLADREGRLENRPKRIKMELFPCDDYDVAGGLARLGDAGFLNSYEINGFSVVEIPSFAKHQSPHGTEKDSELPNKDGLFTVHERGKTGCVTGKQRLSNVKEPFDNALNPDVLNPDYLNPDVLNPDPAPKTKAVEQQQRPDNVVELPTPDDRTGFAKAVAAEYAKAYGIEPPPVPLMLAMEIAARVEFYEPAGSLSWWATYFELCFADLFLTDRATVDQPLGRKAANFRHLVSEKCISDMVDRNKREAAHG